MTLAQLVVLIDAENDLSGEGPNKPERGTAADLMALARRTG